ncbi:branched-chain amino acid ABC transporter permease [Infirmifilum lucidum]|uniref:Branched-chain amino acid ABC transporter permease n=1 Tax=Infirmifilum lucidum TaxID=2776706 RepID=A0A7L9FGK6_9CREN|nr:branched-chain amino acid ABC transporter permease [Infirmifilum lucidum]QOJ78066.1 branched-chain amino acid ABC transporter permease [Infirmifilum lucidum]
MLPEIIVNGLLYSNLLALLSIGLTLTILTSKVSNFAQGDFAVIGVYAAYTASVITRLSPYLQIPVAFATGALVGSLIYLLVFDQLRSRASLVTLMIVSMAIDIILRASMQLYADFLQLTLGVYSRGFIFSDVILSVFGVPVAGVLVFSTATTVLLLLALYLLLFRTKIGIAMRAAIENPSLAETLGINVRRVFAISWALSAGLAAVAGVFLPFRIPVNPDTGFALLLSIFASATLGGLTSLLGSIVGAYLIGFSETLFTFALSSLGLSTAYRPAVSFTAIILTLLLAPGGVSSLWSRRG